MARSLYPTCICLFVAVAPMLSLCADTKPADAVAAQLKKGNSKEAIALAQSLLAKTHGADKSALQVQLAIAYALDQEPASAFSIFLDALDTVPKSKPPEADGEEQRLYREALATYLDHQGPLAHRAAKEIMRDYGPIVEANPTYYLLEFIVAAAYANLSQFEAFFPLFYDAYQRYPQHYLAYKTKALLNLKLWQRGKVPGEREVLRQQVKENIEQAIERYPKDASLYKMAIAFSSDEEKPNVVAACLKNIVEGNIIIPREDVLYFVQTAVSSGHRDLAQSFVESARSWYKHSRAVEHAQQLIDSQG